MPSAKFPKRSKGRRLEDQIVNRVINVLKVITLLLGAMLVAYKAGIGFYVDAVGQWQQVEAMTKKK